MARVIHTAQALVDEVALIDRLPRRGGNAMATRVTRHAGGAVTILLAAARQGAECVHAGAHGTGPHGDLIREVLAGEGVAVSAPVTPELDSGVCFVMVEASAERTFVTGLGAERQITVESLATSAPVAGDVVCISGYTLALERTRDPLLDWLESVDDGVVVVLDPGAPFADFDADLQARVLALTDVWTGNGEESEALTGMAAMDAAASAAVAKLKPGAVAIVRDGDRGCAVAEGSQVEVVAGFPRTAVDTNGAGDTHTGVLVACRTQGLGWVEAARRANAAAAIKVTRSGPDTAPTATEVDDFLSEASSSAPTHP